MSKPETKVVGPVPGPSKKKRAEAIMVRKRKQSGSATDAV
jgi:hypothetical protein